MRKFLAIYTGSASNENMHKWNNLDDETKMKKQKEGMIAWKTWAERNSIIDQGAPVGKTKKVDSSGVVDIKNSITGYVIIEAVSHEEAAKQFLNHPHFSIFPGDSVEIMECLPMPSL